MEVDSLTFESGGWQSVSSFQIAGLGSGYFLEILARVYCMPLH